MRYISTLFLLLITSISFASTTSVRHLLEPIDSSSTLFSTLSSIISDKIASSSPTAIDKSRCLLERWQSALQGAPSSNLYTAAWEIYPLFSQLYSLLSNEEISLNTNFEKDGYLQGCLDKELNEKLLAAFSSVHEIPFLREDCDRNFHKSGHPWNVEESLNQNNRFLMLEDQQKAALRPILDQLKESVASCLGSRWKVCTTRAWVTPPDSKPYGPTSWHRDGLRKEVYKIMYYPFGMSSERGGVELQIQGENVRLIGCPGSWVLFKNSELLHRGLIPRSGYRLAIEVTISCAPEYDLEPHSAGQNALYPHLPWGVVSSAKQPIFSSSKILGINIGGGSNWHQNGWLNLEEATKLGSFSFILDGSCRFPCTNDSIPCIYTSHCIEHLNLATVARVLSESHRVLKSGADLLIKIPDYDRTLECWRNQDASFFDTGWNIDSIVHSWPAKKVVDCIDTRAAMIFCSFTNKQFGNPFYHPTPRTKGAYFGPPTLPAQELRALAKNSTPSQIAAYLRKHICQTERTPFLVHQSAWSRVELEDLLNSYGFEVISFDRNKICSEFEHILYIRGMFDQSTYCWAKKKQ